MGSIKVQTKIKNGKKYEYVYYRISRRSRIKDGGDGKPKTIDKLIGNNSTGQYLEFWLWDGLPAVDYIEAIVSYEMKRVNFLLWGIRWEIDWQFKKGKVIAGKLKFRGTPNPDPECPLNVDARGKIPRLWRRWIQYVINDVLSKQTTITKEIQAIAYSLAKHEQQKRLLIQEESKYREWKKDPHREWVEGNTLWRYGPEYGDRTLENIEICRHNIDHWMKKYEAKISELTGAAPPSERKRFKSAIIRQTEKLAASPNFLDRYAVS